MSDKSKNPVKYGEVVAKCWEDVAYKKRFLEDPEGVLTEAGFVVDEGVTYKVIEQPKQVQYLVLPHADAKEAVQVIAKAFLNQVEQKDVVIPAGSEVRIIQNTDDMRYLILPASPKALTHSARFSAGRSPSFSAGMNTFDSSNSMPSVMPRFRLPATVFSMLGTSDVRMTEVSSPSGLRSVTAVRRGSSASRPRLSIQRGLMNE